VDWVKPKPKKSKLTELEELKGWGVDQDNRHYYLKKREQSTASNTEITVLYHNIPCVLWFYEHSNNLFDVGMSGLERLSYSQVEQGLNLDDPIDTDPTQSNPNKIEIKAYRKDFFWRLRQIANAVIKQSNKQLTQEKI